MNYFTQDTEAAILKFQKEPDTKKRNAIYTKAIHPAFLKLAEYAVLGYARKRKKSIPDARDLQHDCLVHLFEAIGHFDPSKAKAFSYFNVIARNFIWTHFTRKSRRNRREAKVSLLEDQEQFEESAEDKHLNAQRDRGFLVRLEGMAREASSREALVMEAILRKLRRQGDSTKHELWREMRGDTELSGRSFQNTLDKLRKRYRKLKRIEEKSS